LIFDVFNEFLLGIFEGLHFGKRIKVSSINLFRKFAVMDIVSIRNNKRVSDQKLVRSLGGVEIDDWVLFSR